MVEGDVSILSVNMMDLFWFGCVVVCVVENDNLYIIMYFEYCDGLVVCYECIFVVFGEFV